MIRTLSAVALATTIAAALALPAAADTTVKVNITGLSAAAAHAKIVKAARSACSTEYSDSSALEQYYEESPCVDDAVAGAESELKATASNAGPSDVAGR